MYLLPAAAFSAKHWTTLDRCYRCDLQTKVCSFNIKLHTFVNLYLISITNTLIIDYGLFSIYLENESFIHLQICIAY